MTALENFAEHEKEVDRLIEIHGLIAGTGPGYKANVQVLHKAAFVMLTAFWEGYCEDLAEEGLEHLLAHSADASSLPKDLKKLIAKELKDDPDQIAVWSLSDAGWRAVIRTRMTRMTEERNRRLNTPKTKQINELFASTLGMSSLSKHWTWQGMPHERAAERLDEYVSLRGAIAHRGDVDDQDLRKGHVQKYRKHVAGLARTTHSAVAEFVEAATGVALS